jgi:hypothetical protein
MQGQYYPQTKKSDWRKPVVGIVLVIAVGVIAMLLYSFAVSGVIVNPFDDGCCKADDCLFIFDQTVSFAEASGGCACDQFTCVEWCRGFISNFTAGGYNLSAQFNSSYDYSEFDCYSICPRSDTMRCGN